MGGCHVVRYHGYENTGVKRFQTLMGMRGAWHWNGVYAAGSQDSQKYNWNLKFNFTEASGSCFKRSAHCLPSGILYSSVQPSAVSYSTQRVDDSNFAIRHSFIRCHSLGSLFG